MRADHRTRGRTPNKPSVRFDPVVGYDGGADHITGYGGVTPENV
ncbi:hypothetical protein MKK68_00235, partial [Methylobacterium sp. E-016]|nr:hypothetical protein [Methylobacterium sp. E-016]